MELAQSMLTLFDPTLRWELRQSSQAYQVRKITMFCGWLNIKTVHKTKTGKLCSLFSLSFEFVLEILKLDHSNENY